MPEPAPESSGLSIEMDVDSDGVTVGDEVRFSLTVTNRGRMRAQDTLLNGPALPYFDLLRVSTNKGQALVDDSSNSVSVLLGDLQPGEIALVQIFVKVNRSVNFSGDVSAQANLIYSIGGSQLSVTSNAVCIRLEGRGPWADTRVRVVLGFGGLLLLLLGILLIVYGLDKRRKEEGGGGWIFTGLVLILLALLLLVIIFFVLPAEFPAPATAFPGCP